MASSSEKQHEMKWAHVLRNRWSIDEKCVNNVSLSLTLPHPQLMSMYSLCSFHWNHIRKPSSKNVAIKQNLAIVGRTCFPFLITCYIKTHFALKYSTTNSYEERKKWKFTRYFTMRTQQYYYNNNNNRSNMLALISVVLIWNNENDVGQSQREKKTP